MRRQFMAILLSAIGVITCPSADAQSCSDDMLEKVRTSGQILTMISGAIFEVPPGDEIDSSLWLPLSSAVICACSFMSQDGRTLSYYDEGEKVGASRVR